MEAIAEGKPLTQNTHRGRDWAFYLLLRSAVENWCPQCSPFTSDHELKSQVSTVGSEHWLRK